MTAQEHDDLPVLHPLATDVDSNLSRPYAGCLQQHPLVFQNVFVEKDQGWARSSTYSCAVYWAE